MKYLLAASTLLMSPGVAFAQDAEAPAAASAAHQPQEGEIIVTALRRDSTLQETPLAITAITGDNLVNAGVTSVTDYAKMVPSLRVQDNGPGQRRVSLRGILASGEPTVGTYYDETPVAGSVGVASDAGGRTPDFSLFDVERVEVLRGPQGTLYGASSMSGAIRVIFQKPVAEYEGAFDASIGTVHGGGMTYNVNGMVNVPIIEDVLATRLVLYRRDSNGYIENSFLKRKNVNDYMSQGARFLVRFTPNSDIKIDASALIESTDAFSYQWNPLVGRRVSAAQVLLPYHDDSQIYNVTAQWNLGPVLLTGVSSYQHRTSEYAADDSYYIKTFRTPARCASYVNVGTCSPQQLTDYYGYLDSFGQQAIWYPGKTTDWTNEIRLSSTGDGAFSWTIGAFMEDRRNNVRSEEARADPASGEIIMPVQISFRRYIIDHYKQVAGFGEASYKITPELTVTAGARYFSYTKTITGATTIPWTLIGAGLKPRTTVETSQNGWLFKFNADYQFNRDFMIYATASQALRPGGANQVIGLPETLTPYESDKLWNYEFGAKTSFLGRRLFVNGAIYQIDWDNMQVSGRTLNNAFVFIANAGAARIRGAELEISARPAAGLNLTLNGNYLDGKLTQDQISSTVSAPGRAGDRLPYIPHFTGAVTAEYKWDVSDSLQMLVRGDVNHVGSSYSEFRPNNVNIIKMDSYQLANTRVGIEEVSGRWGAYLFLNNVFDATAINRASQSSTPNSYVVTSATPRTLGMTFRTRF